MAGYSQTPLAKKLGIKPGSSICTINAPVDYTKLIGPLPPDAKCFSKPPKAGADIVHLFAPSLAELDKSLSLARKAMKPDGVIWVSWYKKAAKIPTDVTENLIREHVLRTDLVDVKVCAVSEIWSGLKFVVRKHLR